MKHMEKLGKQWMNTHTHTWEYLQKMETHDEQHMVILMNTSQSTLHTRTFKKKHVNMVYILWQSNMAMGNPLKMEVSMGKIIEPHEGFSS